MVFRLVGVFFVVVWMQGAAACDIHALLDENDFAAATQCVQKDGDPNALGISGKKPLNRLLSYPGGATALDEKTTPFIIALIHAGADLNYRPPSEEASAFEALLEFGVHLNARPLVRKMLLREKDPADPNASVSLRRAPPHDEYLRLTPLLWAIKTSDVEIAKFLLDHGVAPGSTPVKEMASPLEHAFYYKEAAIARLLLEKGGMKSVPNQAQWLMTAITAPDRQTPITAEQFELVFPYLSVSPKDFDVKFLADLIRAEMNRNNKNGESLPAFRAAFLKALSLGANPNGVITSRKNSLLQILGSEGRGDLQLEEALLKYGANPNLADLDGDTPLHQIAYDRVDLNARLKKLQANPEVSDVRRSELNSIAQLQALMDRVAGKPQLANAVKDQLRREGIEARLKRLDMLEKLLLKHGANPKLKNREGLMPIQIKD